MTRYLRRGALAALFLGSLALVGCGGGSSQFNPKPAEPNPEIQRMGVGGEGNTNTGEKPKTGPKVTINPN